MNSSTLNTLKHTKRIVLPFVAAAALMAPAAAWAEAPNPYATTAEEMPAPATLPDLAPANPTDVAQSATTLPDLAPANPTDVGRPVVPITLPDSVSSSFGTSGRTAAPSTLPDLPPANPTDVARPATTLPDLAPANPVQVTPETIPAPAALPDLPPANPTQVTTVGQPAGNGGFDFADAGIGVAVVAGALALLLAVAAFFVGRRRRLGTFHS